MEDHTASATVKLRRIVVNPTKPPEAVHNFIWARSGAEFLLDVGYVDLLDAHNAAKATLEGQEVEPIDLIVVHRLSLSPESLRRLSETVQAMMASLAEEV
jgi:hypothetical protein